MKIINTDMSNLSHCQLLALQVFIKRPTKNFNQQQKAISNSALDIRVQKAISKVVKNSAKFFLFFKLYTAIPQVIITI